MVNAVGRVFPTGHGTRLAPFPEGGSRVWDAGAGEALTCPIRFASCGCLSAPDEAEGSRTATDAPSYEGRQGLTTDLTMIPTLPSHATAG